MIMARAGMTAELAQRVAAVFGVALPLTPQRVEHGAISFAWAGPGRWLAAMKYETAAAFERKLREEMSGLASVSGQSDSRTLIRLSGPKLRAPWQRACRSILIHVRFVRRYRADQRCPYQRASLQIDDGPTYEFAVFSQLRRRVLRMAADRFGGVRRRRRAGLKFHRQLKRPR